MAIRHQPLLLPFVFLTICLTGKRFSSQHHLYSTGPLSLFDGIIFYSNWGSVFVVDRMTGYFLFCPCQNFPPLPRIFFLKTRRVASGVELKKEEKVFFFFEKNAGNPHFIPTIMVKHNNITTIDYLCSERRERERKKESRALHVHHQGLSLSLSLRLLLLVTFKVYRLRPRTVQRVSLFKKPALLLFAFPFFLLTPSNDRKRKKMESFLSCCLSGLWYQIGWSVVISFTSLTKPILSFHLIIGPFVIRWDSMTSLSVSLGCHPSSLC